MAQLKKQFDCTAELYRIELCKMWGITYNSTYWVGNDVGGVLDIEGDLYLTFDEVRNLRSWLMDCPHAGAAALYEQLMDIKHGRN